MLRPYLYHHLHPRRETHLSQSLGGSKSLFREHGLNTTKLSIYSMPLQHTYPVPHSDNLERQGRASVPRGSPALVLRMYGEVRRSGPWSDSSSQPLAALSSCGLPTVMERS